MTLQTAQPGARIGEFFWIKWVLANAMGFAAGTAVPSALYQAIVWPLARTASESGVGIVSGILFLLYAISGAVAIGAAQWFFLRRRVRWANSWFLATSLGWLASTPSRKRGSIRRWRRSTHSTRTGNSGARCSS